jgi:hypothetical protein
MTRCKLWIGCKSKLALSQPFPADEDFVQAIKGSLNGMMPYRQLRRASARHDSPGYRHRQVSAAARLSC